MAAMTYSLAVFVTLSLCGAEAQVCSKTPTTLATNFANSCGSLKLPFYKCALAWNAFKEAFAGKDSTAVIPT